MHIKHAGTGTVMAVNLNVSLDVAVALYERNLTLVNNDNAEKDPHRSYHEVVLADKANPTEYEKVGEVATSYMETVLKILNKSVDKDKEYKTAPFTLFHRDHLCTTPILSNLDVDQKENMIKGLEILNDEDYFIKEELTSILEENRGMLILTSNFDDESVADIKIGDTDKRYNKVLETIMNSATGDNSTYYVECVDKNYRLWGGLEEFI